MDLFLLKKLVTYLLYPYTLTLLMLIVGVVLLVRGRSTDAAPSLTDTSASWPSRGLMPRRSAGRGAGKVLAVTGLVLLVLQSLPILPNTIAGRMQAGYAPMVDDADIPKDAKWVVVLSGASNDDPRVDVVSRNVGDQLHRVIEGIVLARRIPGSTLLLSGGSVYGEGPATTVMKQMALELGFPEERIVIEDASRDTEDQAKAIAGMVGKEKMILVTSLRHMPRSMMLFKGYGMEPVPAPTAMPIKPQEFNPMSLLPNARAAAFFGAMYHEIMGIAWAWVRGVGR